MAQKPPACLTFLGTSTRSNRSNKGDNRRRWWILCTFPAVKATKLTTNIVHAQERTLFSCNLCELLHRTGRTLHSANETVHCARVVRDVVVGADLGGGSLGSELASRV